MCLGGVAVCMLCVDCVCHLMYCILLCRVLVLYIEYMLCVCMLKNNMCIKRDCPDVIRCV